jgi:hypothetical protein
VEYLFGDTEEAPGRSLSRRESKKEESPCGSAIASVVRPQSMQYGRLAAGS